MVLKMIMKIISFLSQDKLFTYEELSASLQISNELLKEKMNELENMGFAIKIYRKSSSCAPSACHGCVDDDCDTLKKLPSGLEDEDFLWELTDQARTAI